MDNGDATQGHAMTSAEFAKLMGAYPQPAENPLPAYGGYMDNSPANFSFVEFNDYFGSESEYDELLDLSNKAKERYMDVVEEWEIEDFCDNYDLDYNDSNDRERAISKYLEQMPFDRIIEALDEDDQKRYYELKDSLKSYGAETFEATTGYGYDDPPERMTDEEAWLEMYDNYLEDLEDEDSPMTLEEYKKDTLKAREEEYQMQIKYEQRLKDEGRDMDGNPITVAESFGAETFEAPYGGAGSLMDIGKATPLADFTDEELTTSSAIHGDFDQASLNYSGHQNLEVRAETFNGLSAEEYYAEMEELTDGVASITNRFGDGVGIIQVDDEDLEDVSVEITDGDGDVVYEGILGEDVPEMEEDDFYYTENKKNSSILPMALGVISAVFAYQPVMDFLSSKYKKEEKMAETPELIENPNTGNLDPAQYEELVVESTGYAVDVIPQGLDGSFMGSRFAALPTERYVEYNEPGIGAHTDIALSRDEMYLEPEMAMVQASESVKESQAPGQSPYNSMTGEENADFDMRVLKETEVVSLDPAVKPFIPQSMSGYTGNANTPPSVFNKMFNVGVLGQTPAFVPGSGDIGSSHTGSRIATPNALGLGGSVGGPLSDQVNASYTDGTTSMSLAQWAIENTVSQTSDTEAVVIDRSSGQMKRVRRV